MVAYVDERQEVEDKFQQNKAAIAELRAKGPENWTAEDESKFDQLEQEHGELKTRAATLENQRRLDELNDQVESRDEVRKHMWSRGEVYKDRAIARGVVPNEVREEALQAYALAFSKVSLSQRQENALGACGLKMGDLPQELHIAINHRSPRSGFQLWNNFRTGRLLDDIHFERYLEKRTGMDTLTPGEGLEFVPAETFVNELIRTMVQFGPIRGVVRQMTTATGNKLRFPTTDITGEKAVIVAEEADDAAAVFIPTTGDVSFTAYTYVGRFHVSRELMQDSAINMNSYAAEVLGEVHGRGQSEHFTGGTGVAQPNGIINGGNSGITLDLSELAAGNTAEFDKLDQLMRSVDPAYRRSPSCGWMMNDQTLGTYRRLRDSGGGTAGTGSYIWEPSAKAGDPDMLLGFPVVINQDMPDLAGTNRAVVFGDMAKYLIRDAGTLQMQVLVELLAATRQVSFLSWWRTDGNFLDATALKYAACVA